MRVHIEIDNDIKEPDIIIKCDAINDEIVNIQKIVQDALAKSPDISYYKDGKEYYFSLDKVLFFETTDNIVYAHVSDDTYKVKERLYELERKLPKDFIRVSKSTILNTNHVYSVERNITSYSLVEFYKSHKKVYVSRFYYKNLKHKLEERRSL